ncbi:FUSC family protein [Hoeflea sp. WL0058]|uniref:FUSC family protein n=1 Tax=Flavimaribacter sediminis TaxID=2865987 RepID=A0AAE2ZNZ3_9HYPH|nr:FUSC family protein [Flavimaribacter sediminis]MBW8640068.1 FUSC family protein [Flavimaribacter sediminis]
MTWRIALLCSLVSATAMMMKIPEAAISCYLVIFLMKPDAAQNIVMGAGLILLASIVVVIMIPVINLTIDNPPARLAIIFFASYLFLFLSSTTPLGEQAAIVGLIIAFLMTLVTDVPVGQIADQGLLMAWKMAAMPMLLMIVFNLFLGFSTERQVRDKVVKRLSVAAEHLRGRDKADEIDELLGEGNETLLSQMQLVKLLYLCPRNYAKWLNGAVETSYAILVSASHVTRHLPEDERSRLANALLDVAGKVSAKDRNVTVSARAQLEGPGVDIWREIADLSHADGGGSPHPQKPPLLSPDAFSNPDHQRYALKTSVAAVICYLLYTGLHWDGIHTAMITCYVAALGSTGETVRKLALRIIGCLIGAAMGVLALLFIMPSLTSIGGLMLLVFAGVFIAGWVSSGNERISYAGVQIALAFLLTILNGFGPSFEFSQASDRIVGILIGNVVIYFIFTQFWPRSAMTTVRQNINSALDGLMRLADRPSTDQRLKVEDVSGAYVRLGAASQLLETTMFEPATMRPPASELDTAAEAISGSRDLAGSLFAGDAGSSDIGSRLKALRQ